MFGFLVECDEVASEIESDVFLFDYWDFLTLHSVTKSPITV